MKEDAHFEQFVDRYFDHGERDVPAAWPNDLRKRCIFFLRMMESGAEGESLRSSITRLKEQGVDTDFSLPDVAPPGKQFTAEDLRGTDQRYVVEEEIAQGGMGRILLAYDRDFRRRIAMKVMLGNVRETGSTSRFIQEAQTTAQLEHPHIGPVYDIGVDGRGSPFFTMKWIRGRNLADLLRAGGKEFSLTRLVQILQQAAMGVHFANTKGVIHRDLKPQNIMVGDFGEVLVVDWGLAKILGRAATAARAEAEPPISTTRAERQEETLHGSVQGSIAYMAPEQARGELSEIDVRTDVFGLGAILYEILTGSAPYQEASPQAALARARRADLVPPLARAPGRGIPAILEEICRKALAPARDSRYRSAGEFHQALQEYIEGIHSAERQAAEGSRLLWVAEHLYEELRAAESREAELRREEAALRTQVREYDPEEKKQRLWDLTEKARAAREAVASEFTRTTAAYLAVLSIAPDHRQARGRLSHLYYRRLVAAEERGDRETAAVYKSLVAQYHDGELEVELAGVGNLRLRSDPPGATVLLSRFEERGLILAETGREVIGTTPVEKPLPPGSYLAVLWREGFCEARYPFIIYRCEAHAGSVRLVPRGGIPEGFVQVPGGPTLVGTDFRECGLERRRLEVGDLFAGRHPVTFGEYCAFLNDCFPVAEAPPAEYKSAFGTETYVERTAGGFAPVSKLDPRMAVMAVSYAAALAYAGWLGKKLGKSVRLLREEEWERCARGADGRLYPWGNGFDWAFCKGAFSLPGEPFPAPVGTFPRDVSVFGIQDLAGTVRELCEGWAREGYRPCRGGSWFNSFPFIFRADFRTRQRDVNRATDSGFRVCYDAGGLEAER
jgi:serine/threonine-protein kinase